MNLEQLRKRAKDLLRDARAGNHEATARIHRHHLRRDAQLKLADAQLAIAREQGFPSWPRLRAFVVRLAANSEGIQFAYHEDMDYYEGRAFGLLASARDGTLEAAAVFGGASLTIGDARLVVARAHGFPSWRALRRHIADLSSSGEPFWRAYRAIEENSPSRLAEALDRWPNLVHQQGTNGNDLLGMATATGNQDTVRLLLDRGANPSRPNAHGWTPLHQTGYSNAPELAGLLLDHGADPSRVARGEGGTPLVAALFWGHRQVSTVLAERGGMQPHNLRTAAGLGDLEAIEALAGTPAATSHRGFYRPHSGFPEWTPSNDPTEALDEALAWAARADRVDALALLVRLGARLEADVYRGTALTWAAANGRVASLRRLIELGADPNGRGTFGGPEHGVNIAPLHIAAQNGHLEIIHELLAAGADRCLRDDLHHGTPTDWAHHCGQPAASALLS